jgi:uncharacterized membrane protein
MTHGYRGTRRHSPALSSPGVALPTWPASTRAVAVTGLFVAVANVLAVSHLSLPFLGPAIGFWFLVLLPTYLLYTTRLWGGAGAGERIAYSITSVLLVLMLAGLAINSLLPLLGYQRPLSPIPIVVLGDIINLSLYLCRRRYPGTFGHRLELGRIPKVSPRASRLIIGSALSVALAVAGANRLNNGAGDTVSLAALACMVVVLVLLLLWHSRVGEGVTCGVIYMVSLGLLLMTSLRGWYVTGHDIQTEYFTFQLTAAHAHWSMTYVHNNAYYACLSITILPTELVQVAHVAGPYIYKVFFQILFAFCPVLVYLIARRFFPVIISIIATIFFISYPTFFTDMPYINRQEIAFLFTGVAILAITNSAWSLRWRQAMLFAAALGIELAHYSTMYFLVSVCLIAWIGQFFALRQFRRAKDESAATRTAWATNIRTVGIGSIVVLVGITLIWGQFLTQTSSSAFKDAAEGIGGVVAPNGLAALQIQNVPIFGSSPDLQTALNQYRQAAFIVRAVRREKGYIPLGHVYAYDSPEIVSGTPNLPLTAVGRLLGDVGISATEVNTFIRNAAAKDELLFSVVGFAALFVARRLRRSVGREVFFIGAGCIVMLGLVLVLPNLSIDYGIVRGFQQSLIVIAPVLVLGALATFSPFGRTAALRMCAVLAVAIFISTSGFLPQVLGGYPAQLSLNNSGQYYDVYYEHPQEVAAVSWLGNQPDVLADGVQASFTSNRFAFTTPSEVNGREVVGDIYPPLVRVSSWVVISDWTMHSGLTASYFNGDLITYKYPLKFLQVNKNLVFNDGGAEIFR